MNQQFFLAVVTNILGGWALSDTFLRERIKSYSAWGFAFFEVRLFRSIIGVLAVISGALSLFAPHPLSVPILGDLFPAISSLILGLVLLVESYAAVKSGVDSPFTSKVVRASHKYGVLMGVLGILIGIIHFFSSASAILI